jgi:hypothetical protein
MICLPCRSTRGHAACQPAIKLQCWDNRSALPMRDSRTWVRCALPAHADQKEISAASRLHRRTGSADFCRLQNGIPPSELRASRPRHHASERWSGRWITLSLATLASVKVSKTAPDKTVSGTSRPNCVRGSPRITGHNFILTHGSGFAAAASSAAAVVVGTHRYFPCSWNIGPCSFPANIEKIP